jgi:hypothetical protein
MRAVQRAEAQYLVDFGRAEGVGSHEVQLKGNWRTDPTTITAAESELNALASAGMKGRRAVVARTREKIEAWLGDNPQADRGADGQHAAITGKEEGVRT